MKLLLSLLVCAGAWTTQAQTWEQLASVPSPGRDDATAFAIGSYGYIVTGNHGGFSESNKLWQYDPQSGSWTEKTPFPGTPRQYAASFVLDGKAYIVMGISESSAPLNDVWRYDPATDQWTQLHDFPGAARWSLFAFATIEDAYVGTGSTLSGLLQDCWKYIPSADTWLQLPDFPGGQRRETVSFALGEKGCVGLGYAGFGGSDFRSDMYCWSELSEQWTQLPDFPGGARSYATAVGTNTYGYVGTGQDDADGFYADCYRYDPAVQQWEAVEQLPLHIKGMSAFAIGDTPYFLTGISADYIRVSGVWKLDDAPKTNDPYMIYYPNPAAGHFVVKAWNGSTVQVFTTDGKCIRETLVGVQETALFEVLSPGTYKLRITTNEEIFTGTIVIL